MLKTSRMMCAILMLCVLISLPVRAADSSRYDELLKAPGPSATVRSVGMLFLALPFERQSVQQQIGAYWWSNNPALSMDPAQRDLENAELRNKLDTVSKLVSKHELTRVDFAGYTSIGNVRNYDLYYVADTEAGPIMFRASFYQPDAADPLFFDIQVYRGFDQSREASAAIENKAGARILSVTYDPKAQQKAE